MFSVWQISFRKTVECAQKFHRFTKLQNNINLQALTARSVSTISVDNDIAVWELNRPPVNSINLDVWMDISNVLTQAEENKWRGLILTSASPKIFSAGIDLSELCKPDVKRLESMLRTMQEIVIKMSTCGCVTAAAINGHSSAGGTLLSAFCDYRVMVDGNFTIGFNDTAVGIVPQAWIVKMLSHVLTTRKAELAIVRSTMFSPKEALEVGLVDELASDKADAIKRCKNFIRTMDHIAPKVISMTRQVSREMPLSSLIENREKDMEHVLKKIMEPETQQIMENYMIMLKNKKKSVK